MLIWKVNVLAELKQAGYNSNRLRIDGILSQSTIQKLREGKGLAWENINTLCRLLNCQPGDLMEYVPDSDA